MANTTANVDFTTLWNGTTKADFLETTATEQLYPDDDSYSLLKQLEFERFIARNIPVTSYLVILCLIGTIGNFHALLVYSLRYKCSNHRTFVIWLAAVDLIACAISIPFEIVDTRYGYTFYSEGACKIFRFLNHFVSACSGALLAVIAVERYRKACKPLGRQLTEKEAKCACCITVVVTGVLSIPALIFYGPSDKLINNYPNLIGKDCTVLSNFKRSNVFKGYNFVLLLISTVIFITCIVTYTFVGKVLYRQVKFRRATQTRNPKQRLTSMSSNTQSSDLPGGRRISHEQHIEDEQSSMQGNGNYLTNIPSTPTSPKSLKIKFSNAFKKRRLFDRSKQITFMFLVATAVSYAGFLPYQVLIIIQAVSKGTSIKVATALGPFNSIFMRGYFLNNVTNPVVYCFMDERFRAECKNVYKLLKKKICSLRCRNT